MTTSEHSIDLQGLKRLARSRLNADRLEAALPAFGEVLRHDPTDVEACLALGDGYLAAGDPASAQALYAQAAEYAPASAEVRHRLALVQAELGGVVSRAPIPPLITPAALARLVRGLNGGQSVVTDQELDRAAAVLREIVTSPRPAEAVARQIQDVETLIPALLALNIRQARTEGRLDLAAALEQLCAAVQPAGAPEPARVETAGLAAQSRILVVGPDSPRLRWINSALRAAGYAVEQSESAEAEAGLAWDAVIAHQPHHWSRPAEHLAALTAAGARLILSLEDDVVQLAPWQTAGARLEPAARERLAGYTASLRLADAVCVPSPVLAETFQWVGVPAHVVPPGWDQADPAWMKARLPDQPLTLGWLSSWGEADDLAEVRRALISLTREFPELHVLVAGDLKAYQLFQALPESRRRYVPLLSPDDEPAILAQLDVLLLPWRDTAANRARSDAPLVAAGARRLAWVASPSPAVTAWKAGGLLADGRDEWYAALRRLVLAPELRAELGAAGARSAAGREVGRLGRLWRDIIAEVLQPPAGPREAAPLPVAGWPRSAPALPVAHTLGVPYP